MPPFRSRLCALALALATGMLHLPPALAQRVAATEAEQRASDDAIEIPFELGSNKLYTNASVNGQGPYPFVIDTGAPFTVIDWQLAQSLGIGVHPTGSTGGAGEGKAMLGTARDVRITFGPLRYQPGRVEVIPLNSTLSIAEGRDVMGLLGGELLARFVPEFDFRAGVVRLHSRAHFQYDGPAAHTRVRIDGHVLARATVVFPGRAPITGRFIIDTGARVAVSLNTRVVDDHHLLADDIPHIRTTVGWGIGGPLEHGLARATSLTVGGVTFEAPTVTLSQDTKGVFADRRLTGVIGAEVLKRCRVIIDYDREELYLEPDADAVKAPFPADASGLFITAGGPHFQAFTIRGVVEGSPGAAAGLEPGDEIEAFEGGPAYRFTLEELRELLRQAGREYRMEIKRGEERRVVSLATRALI